MDVIIQELIHEHTLLPCPFCGEAPTLNRIPPSKKDINSSDFWLVMCRKRSCWAHLYGNTINEQSHHNVLDAVETWNERPKVEKEIFNQDLISYASRHDLDDQPRVSYHTLFALLAMWAGFLDEYDLAREYNNLTQHIVGGTKGAFDDAGVLLDKYRNEHEEEFTEMGNAVYEQLSTLANIKKKKQQEEEPWYGIEQDKP